MLGTMKKVVQGRKYQARARCRSGAALLSRGSGWRASLAVTAGLALLAMAGCGSAGSTQAGSQGSGTSSEGSGSGGGVASTGGSGHHSRNGGQSAVAKGVLFGGDVPLAAEESKLGRRLAIVRVYDHLGEKFPNAQLAHLMSEGTTVLVSLDTFPGGATYSSIAAGNEDAEIKTFLNSVNQAAIRYRLSAIYVTFEHEVNDAGTHRGLGTPAQFVQAWDHIHGLAASAHLNWNDGGRLHWVLILTHYGYLNGSASQFWPGTGEVDVVAADGYNTGGCRVARRTGASFTVGKTAVVNPSQLFSTTVRFAEAHGNLPVIISEWGSVAYSSPSVRVNWIHQMQAFVEANHDIVAALYWDSEVPPCNYEINNSSSSLAALADMGHSPDLQGTLAN
jgi:hypothetical protein